MMMMIIIMTIMKRAIKSLGAVTLVINSPLYR